MMKRLLLAALSTSLLAVAPAHAQKTGKLLLFQLPQPDAPRQPNRYSYDPATLDTPSPPKGARILVGTEIAPETVMGVGLFNSTPRYRGRAEDNNDVQLREKRKVGVGLSMKF